MAAITPDNPTPTNWYAPLQANTATSNTAAPGWLVPGSAFTDPYGTVTVGASGQPPTPAQPSGAQDAALGVVPTGTGGFAPAPSGSGGASGGGGGGAATPAPDFSTGNAAASLYNTGPTSAPSVTYPTAPANASTATSDAYQKTINDQITQLEQPVSASSPAIQAQTNAYNLTAQRGATAAQEAAAQAGYAQGNLNSGSQSVQQMLINEALGEGEATNTGNVMATAEAQRQAALANDINTGTSAAGQQQQTTAQQNQYGSTLGLNVAGLQQTAGQQAVSSAQQQQIIDDALAAAIAQQQLGYYGVNTNAQLGAASQLGQGG